VRIPLRVLPHGVDGKRFPLFDRPRTAADPVVFGTISDLPVIATDWSGPADYLDPADSLPLDYRLIDAPGQVNPYVRFDGL
jgi:hypothetical protein